MFYIFKQDVKLGDKVKLSLTTGKEPEGIVLEIGDNSVLLEVEDKTQSRIFDKLIGGWDVIAKRSVIPFNPITQNIKKKSEVNEDKHLVSIDLDIILKSVIELLNPNFNIDFETLIEPNANIIDVNKSFCHATNAEFSDIIIKNSIVFDKELLTEIESFSRGSIIPVVIQCYKNKKDKVIATNVFLPNTLKAYIVLFRDCILNNNYTAAKYIFSLIKFKLRGKGKPQINIIAKELNKFTQAKLEERIINISPQHVEDKEEKQVFKQIEKRITDLLKQGEFESALRQIDKELKNNQLDEKYKSSLLLKKAQTYSSLNNPSKSEEAYKELIAFNEKTGSSNNNLSHLYTELARLQALNPEKQSLALEAIRKALKYNPNNNFANNLLNQFQGKSVIPKTEVVQSGEDNLIVEAEDDSTVISKMIDIDIKEHKFTNPDILKNAGKPTAFIAQQIFEIAKETRDIDLSERYPLYLEAAKAFSELNVGSYDLQDYLESAAYYAMLKGNSLFINFRNQVQNNIFDIKELTRLKDSAGSYYMESLNLLSNIEPKLLLTIMSNYLKLNIVLYKFSHNESADFKGQFSNVFFDCIRSKNKELEQIAYQTIVSIGTASTQAWNKLSNIQGGTGGLYNEFFIENKRTRIYELINKFEESSIDITLNPSVFLKKAFLLRKQKQQNFEDAITKVSKISVEPHNLFELSEKWDSLEKYFKLLSTTDMETKEKVDEILSILKPYLNRNQTERTNLLIQSKRIIETQIKFIAKNTTFYGRTFFFPLLNKWKKEIDALLEEKIAQSYPSLEVLIDPPYFVETNGKKVVNVIIKNNGETTAEGFELIIVAESTVYKETEQEFTLSSYEEIPAGNRVSTSFVMPPELLEDSKAVEIEIDAIAVYQRKKIEAKNFLFTIEEEPQSTLTYDDIVWKDGPIPEKHLFLGRKQIIADLAQHYESVERDKPYILYGLTRTGKSSILKYLQDDLQGDTFTMKGKEMTLLSFWWDLSEAASFKNAPDFWEYLLYQQVYEELDDLAKLYRFDFSDLSFSKKPRAKDFPVLLNYFQSKNIYPLFLVDEFSFIKTLIDGDIVNSAFLHTLRQHSLNGLASFIYAGTYDIKQLISDPKYGITGQLVNAIEEQVNEISNKDAEALIEIMGDRLKFTPEAVSHIQYLSGNIPYFIQIICKYCGYYASENNRQYIGYPELEKVVKILTGREVASTQSLVKNLPENIFQNNQFSPAEPREVNVLISSIVHFNKDRINDPRGVGFDELQRLWAEKGVTAFRPKLADAINLLKDKKILVQKEDEGIPVYKFAVDLFRRWWAVHHSDIDLEITTII